MVLILFKDKTLRAFSPQAPDQRDFIPLESPLLQTECNNKFVGIFRLQKLSSLFLSSLKRKKWGAGQRPAVLILSKDKTLRAFSPQTPDQRDFIPLESPLLQTECNNKFVGTFRLQKLSSLFLSSLRRKKWGAGQRPAVLLLFKDKTLRAFSPQTPDQRDFIPLESPSFCRQNVTVNSQLHSVCKSYLLCFFLQRLKDKTLGAFSPQTPDQRSIVPLESLLFSDRK
jgi:hypothetical protein